MQSLRKILVLRKVNRTTKNSTFQILQDTLSEWKLLPYCKVNKTDFSIMLPNGSQFICIGLDDQEKLKSIVGLTDAWLEEATEFTQNDFNQVDLRIRERVDASQIILSLIQLVKLTGASYSSLKKTLPQTHLEQDVILFILIIWIISFCLMNILNLCCYWKPQTQSSIRFMRLVSLALLISQSTTIGNPQSLIIQRFKESVVQGLTLVIPMTPLL